MEKTPMKSILRARNCKKGFFLYLVKHNAKKRVSVKKAVDF